MAEGKTNMFGKAYNTIGSTDSNFIIKTKGDLKVQWGNKYIDVIKNGKIASPNSDILFLVDNPDLIKLNGVYIVTAEDGGELWVCIDGIKVLVDNTTGENVYVSFMMELSATNELKHLALTNIGFYYETLQKARMAKINSGIIYVEEDNKLYIANKGQLILYSLTSLNLNVITPEITPDSGIKQPLYIQDYSLYADGTEYIQCSSGTIKLFLPTLIYNNLLWHDATSDTGYKLYIKNQESVLDIDRINWRKYPNPITYSELLALIKNEKLNPKMYYILSDFQNPWEVTWKEEPFLYEDKYVEINEVLHLGGLRNANKLIILAKSNKELEKLVWDTLHPDWIIYYDHTYRGPEHKVIIDNVEHIYYGFRTRINEINNETEYLSCKGIITYLKDDLGNEGNFNFRQFRFKHGNKWRFIMDSEPSEILGKFINGSRNTFNFENIDTYVLIFKFKEILDESENLLGFDMSTIEADLLLSEGHHMLINTVANNNIFNLPKAELTIKHTIYGNITNNKFLNIKELISIYPGCVIENNTFLNFEKGLLIEISCKDNTLDKFLEDVVIKGGLFNGNYLSNFVKYIDNTGTFENNIVENCPGTIKNTKIFSENYIEKILATITNKGDFKNNTLLNVKADIENYNIFSGNTIDSINAIIINKGDISNNTITEILSTLTNNLNTISDNTIVSINTLVIEEADIKNNNIKNIYDCKVYDLMYNNQFLNLNSNTFKGTVLNNVLHGDLENSTLNVFTNNIAYKNINELISEENVDSCIFNLSITKLTATNLNYCTFEYINNLVLTEKPVYYTTFHGYIGNITRELTIHEWKLLEDASKKKDAYPNIRVVCVPEIIKKGMILMWYGKEPIPDGWALCDGKNGTPNLVGSFIKGDSTTADDPTFHKDIDPETNEFTLKEENLPEHHHPHDEHNHEISELKVTIEPTKVLTSYSLASAVLSVSGEGVSYSSGYSGDNTSKNDHSHTATVSGGKISPTESKEKVKLWLNKPIKIEPKHFKIIFIMKIDENPE